jgi:hypothetical protein
VGEGKLLKQIKDYNPKLVLFLHNLSPMDAVIALCLFYAKECSKAATRRRN